MCPHFSEKGHKNKLKSLSLKRYTLCSFKSVAVMAVSACTILWMNLHLLLNLEAIWNKKYLKLINETSPKACKRFMQLEKKTKQQQPRYDSCLFWVSSGSSDRCFSLTCTTLWSFLQRLWLFFWIVLVHLHLFEVSLRATFDFFSLILKICVNTPWFLWSWQILMFHSTTVFLFRLFWGCSFLWWFFYWIFALIQQFMKCYEVRWKLKIDVTETKVFFLKECDIV